MKPPKRYWNYPSVPKQSYFVRYGDRLPPGEGRYRHKLCGRPPENCPLCPNCDKPFIQLARFDGSDPRLEQVADLRLAAIPLIICWKCNFAQSEFYYRLSSDGSIDLLIWKAGYYEGGKPDPTFPYEDYPEAFSEKAAWLEPIARADEETVKQINRDLIGEWELPSSKKHLTNTVHQLGGKPYLVQCAITYPPECPDCRRKMPLFAVIANDNGHPRGFMGYDFIQHIYHICPRCGVVAGYVECD